VGGLDEVLAHIDELKLASKAGAGANGRAVYGMLKREMWRETVGYLEHFGAEDGRDFVVEARKGDERRKAEEKVRAWEAKAKL